MAKDQALITAADIEAIFPIGKNLPDEKINQVIFQAQLSDLEPFLGDNFYYLVYNDQTGGTPTSRINELMEGKEYEYQGETVLFRGLKVLLAAYAYAKLLRTNWFNVTRGGNTTKLTPESTNVGAAANAQKIREAEAFAGRLEADARKFLDQEAGTYPEYNRATEIRGGKKGFRFFKS